MKIVSWNVAGIRSILKKDCFYDFIGEENPDIICFQETKALENEVNLLEELKEMYPYRYWNSNNGESQRKGLSGTAIFSKIEAKIKYPTPLFDNEGRILTLGFKIEDKEFILVTTYVPNSQNMSSPRYNFRNEWNTKFNEYLLNLGDKVIVCGDMNVAHEDIDIYNPRQKYNKIAGFFNSERENMTNMLKMGFIDLFRYLNPSIKSSTYWSNFLKQPHTHDNGWRIDYFLIRKELLEYFNFNYKCYIDVSGSDHCPIELSL